MKSLYTIFTEALNHEVSHEASIYRQLFSMKPEKVMEQDLQHMYDLHHGLDSFFKEEGKECWFEVWHKSIRQVGFFENCSQTDTQQLLTDQELREMRTLRHQYKFETREQKTAGAKGTLFNNEYRRYLELHRRRIREDIEIPINGKLDSILWNFIQIDGGFLYKTFLTTFALFDVEKEIVQ